MMRWMIDGGGRMGDDFFFLFLSSRHPSYIFSDFVLYFKEF